MKSLSEHLKSEISDLPSFQSVLVGISGGMDSVVLLHALVQLKLPQKIYALHVNHQLHADAMQWQKFCTTFCESLKVSILVEQIHLSNKASNLEARAREKRYACFAAYLSENAVLMTAHQQNDQTETFFLQLLRGCGIAGLSAMPAVKPFGKGMHVRPLLNIPRDLIFKYAKDHNLRWVEDESNSSLNFDRNYLRHQILPQLQKRFPHLNHAIFRATKHFGESLCLLNELAAIDFVAVKTEHLHVIDWSHVKSLSQARQKNLLRYWFKLNQAGMPSEKQINIMIQQLSQATSDRNPKIQWGGFTLKRYQQKLFLFHKKENFHGSQVLNWDLKTPLVLPENLGTLIAKSTQDGGIKILPHQKITIRFRCTGERINLACRGHRALKKIMQEWQIPTWERDKIPLLYLNDDLAAVIGYAIAKEYRACEGETSWNIQLKPDKVPPSDFL